MIKRIISAALSVLAAVGITAAVPSSAEKEKYINNAALLPKWVPDSEVTLDENYTPDWIKTLILGEVHINTATDEGTLDAAVKVLDHYAETGINGIWVTPVYDPGTTGNGYGNLGPDTIDPAITGTTDYAEGWKRLKGFIDEAHKRNIRIILDVISWGTVKESPLVTAHPDWYDGKEVWGGYEFNWNNDGFVEWYINEIVDIAMKTGCDGFRYDVEPSYAGYTVHGKIRDILLGKGRKLLMISEQMNERGKAYDMEQTSVGGFGAGYTAVNHYFLDSLNIVDSIKEGKNIGSTASQNLGMGGMYKYYTNCITCHDHYYPQTEGKRTVLGYEAIFSPFIPMWYLGEEWNNSRDADLNTKGTVLYFNSTNWNELNNKENRDYFEDVKAMIKIRRSYPELFETFADEFRESNICKVNVAGCEATQPYARFADNKAMLIIPNNNIHRPNAQMTVYIPFVDTGLDYYKSYTVTDAETGRVIVKGSASKVAKFRINVPHNDQRVFLVTATGKIDRYGDGGNYGDNEYIDNEPDNANGDNTETVVIKKRRKKKADVSEFPIIPVVCAAAGVLLIAGGTVVFIIIKRKKKEQK